MHMARALSFVCGGILLLTVPSVGLGQPAAAGPPDLAPEACVRLMDAARDSRLAPWQRNLMLRLARTDTTFALDPSAAALRAARPALASGAVDGAWKQRQIRARYEHSAIHDPVRDRIVVFGGFDNDVWALSLAGAPAWTLLTPLGTPPSGRGGHSAIYDPVRDRMVVFGGLSDSCLNDVWALALGGTPAWTQLTPSGTPPSARGHHTAIYDPLGDRMVVFGGLVGPADGNDVWALSLASTPAWTQLTPSGTPPSARHGHSAIYDPVRERMVVFGGQDGSGFLNDVWMLSLGGTPVWTQLTPGGAPPGVRTAHTAIYDPVRDRMMVFGGYIGGYHGSGYLNDVWELGLAGTPAWTQLDPTGALPRARGNDIAVYDPLGDRMVVFAGSYSDIQFRTLSDVWALPLAGTPVWAQLTPSARDGHSAIYDPVRNRMVVFGGYPYQNDVWALSLAGPPAWTQLTPSGTPPGARAAHTAIYDPVRDRMVVFGGYDASADRNDVWVLSLGATPAWTELTPTGTPPSGREYPTAIYDPVRDRMLVFGGYDASGDRNDVWELSLAWTPAWTELTPTGVPPSERAGPTAIYDPTGDRMVVFGGSGAGFLNDVWELSLAGTPAWTELTPSGVSPGARAAHTAIYDPVRNRMVVFGGLGSTGGDDVWALALAGPPAWARLTPMGTLPSGRGWHSAIYDPLRDGMVVFGGYEASADDNDVWALEWNPTATVGGPKAQPLFSGLWPPVPNPTRGTTAVSYALAQAGRVQLGVYDVSGRLVRQLVDGERGAGAGTADWNGTDESGARLEAGVYFVQLAGPVAHETRRVILLR